MGSIDQRLLGLLQKRLDLKRARVYKLISKKVNETYLSRPLAAIALASEQGLNISKFATKDELTEIRATLNRQPGSANSAPLSNGERKPTSHTGHRLESKTKSRRAKTARATRPRGARKFRKPRVKKTRSKAKSLSNTVFVVHGRNEALRRAVFEFLRALALKPLEWNQVLAAASNPTPEIGGLIQKALSQAAAIVIILSPDDEARLRKTYRKASDPRFESQLTGQARPNVLFEAGMALAIAKRQCVLVQAGDLRPFSDIAGRHTLRLDDSAESRQQFVTKLKVAGLSVDISGTDWLRAGRFNESLSKSPSGRRRGRAPR